ncbi:MAG: hypothetical protein ACIAS6_10880 [Phycisphaerales bacterium JB060]
MRNLWTIVSVLALANLFAIGGVAGWLGMTERLDRERFDEMKRLLAETPEQRETRLASEAAEEESRQQEVQALRDQVETLMTSPMTAEELVQLQQEAAMAADQRMTRAMRELEDLRDLLARERQETDRLAEAIEMQRDAFEARIAERDRLLGQEQFRTAVDTLQGQRAPAAYNLLMAMWEGQAEPAEGELDGHSVVVEYLRAMDDRQRNKVMAEFEKNDATLAAVLLERLRTDGVTPEVADAAADPDQPEGP